MRGDPPRGVRPDVVAEVLRALCTCIPGLDALLWRGCTEEANDALRMRVLRILPPEMLTGDQRIVVQESGR